MEYLMATLQALSQPPSLMATVATPSQAPSSVHLHTPWAVGRSIHPGNRRWDLGAVKQLESLRASGYMLVCQE